jgi:hypothetical protein
MMNYLDMRQTRWIGIVVALAGLVAATEAGAETSLRWQLQPGDVFTLQVDQQTKTNVGFSGKSAETTIDLGMTLGWNVTAADDKSLTIEQTVERIKFRLDSPTAGKLEVDTAVRARPSGQARKIADAIGPLVGAKIELVISPRGEVQSAKPLGEAAEKLLADAGPLESGVFSAAAIRTLLKQPLAELPEGPVTEGESWSSTSELAASLGKFTQSLKYSLAAPVEREGRSLAQIDLVGTLVPMIDAAVAAPAPGAGNKPPLVLKSHELTGKSLFDAEQGRLVSAEQTQTLATERPYRETTISVRLASTQTTTFTPKTAEPADAK